MNYLKIFWHFNALKNDNDRLTYITGQKSSLIIKKINRAKFKIKQYHKIYIINKLEGARGAEPLSPPPWILFWSIQVLNQRERNFISSATRGGGGKPSLAHPPPQHVSTHYPPPLPTPSLEDHDHGCGQSFIQFCQLRKNTNFFLWRFAHQF